MKKLFFLFSVACALATSCAPVSAPVRIIETGARTWATNIPNDLYSEGDTIVLMYSYPTWEYSDLHPSFEGNYLKVSVGTKDSVPVYLCYQKAVIISKIK